MPISAQQILDRKQSLGSSDMAAVLGLDHRRNAYDVWLEKSGKLIEQPQPDNGPMAAGNYFENGVLDYAEKELGPLSRNQHRKHTNAPLAANIDAIVIGSGLPVEAKTAGLFGPINEYWGDAGSDEVPNRVIVQCYVHMLCTLTDVCYVPAFLGGRGFQTFVVKYDNDIGPHIRLEAVRFWKEHVETGMPPVNVTPHLDFIKRLRREPAKTVPIDLSLIEQWQTAKDAVRVAHDAKDAAEAELFTALGDAEAGECETGTFTYYEQTRKAYEVSESTYRVARFKKNKKEKT